MLITNPALLCKKVQFDWTTGLKANWKFEDLTVGILDYTAELPVGNTKSIKFTDIITTDNIGVNNGISNSGCYVLKPEWSTAFFNGTGLINKSYIFWFNMSSIADSEIIILSDKLATSSTLWFYDPVFAIEGNYTFNYLPVIARSWNCFVVNSIGPFVQTVYLNGVDITESWNEMGLESIETFRFDGDVAIKYDEIYMYYSRVFTQSDVNYIWNNGIGNFYTI